MLLFLGNYRYTDLRFARVNTSKINWGKKNVLFTEEALYEI